MKKCSTCKTLKSHADFNKKRSTKDGLERYCKECHKERNKKHYVKHKQRYVDTAVKARLARKRWWFEFKSTLCCTKCGENRPWCLDFHHTDPTIKESSLSLMVSNSSSKERLMKEIEKCIVLCKNCHADYHYNESRLRGVTATQQPPNLHDGSSNLSEVATELYK
jgi:hypothetical protein